ncbi:MAG: sugar transporter [Fibrobacter sp.]|jgi:glucose uptake protein|nr:sugar transporter [Fibrobacter sp.]MBR2058373.1 sugar transporter [Fibrobacter sp.]MBR4007297.1 sugar transporter [Fibrobacter sp.]
MVPLKKYPNYSSWAFLAVMAVGALFCSTVIAGVTGQFNLAPVGIFCGLLWVIGGALCFWAVQAEQDLAGTGLRSMSVSILLSFFSGVVIFQEPTLLYFSIPAIACMVIGIWIPASKTKSVWKNWRSLLSGAIFGTYLIPYKFSSLGDMEFLFPFSVGVCVGSVLLVAIMTLKRKKSFGYPKIPTLFAFASGILWMLGTLAIFWAIADDGMFGYAVGYPLLQLNLVVNQMWGVFVFGEYASRHGRIKLALSTIVILVGAVLLTLSKM